MKEVLSRKEVTRYIVNGFEVYMEYIVGLGWENGRKIHILGIFRDMYRYTLNMYRYILGSGHFWPTCTGIGPTCTGTPCSVFPVSTRFRILAITFSFFLSDLSDSSG